MLLGILLVIQILVCCALVGVILLQRSEGGALGMGGGANNFMTARGAGDLLTRTTGILAATFFILSIALTIVAGHARGGGSIVDRLKVDGVEVSVFNAAKTIADCFKFRNKIGLDVALEALRDGWQRRKVTMDDLWRYAAVDRVANVMRPYLETIAAS